MNLFNSKQLSELKEIMFEDFGMELSDSDLVEVATNFTKTYGLLMKIEERFIKENIDETLTKTSASPSN